MTECDLAPLRPRWPPTCDAPARGPAPGHQPQHPHPRTHPRQATSTWMPFRGEQVKRAPTDRVSYRPVLDVDARLPRRTRLDVLHVFVGARRHQCGSEPPHSSRWSVREPGRRWTTSRPSRCFNDLCVLAPAALVDADVAWTVLGPDLVHARFTRGARDHRRRPPLRRPRRAGGLRLRRPDGGLERRPDLHPAAVVHAGSPTTAWCTGAGWPPTVTRAGEAPTPQETFTYLELAVDDIEYNLAPTA